MFSTLSSFFSIPKKYIHNLYMLKIIQEIMNYSNKILYVYELHQQLIEVILRLVLYYFYRNQSLFHITIFFTFNFND